MGLFALSSLSPGLLSFFPSHVAGLIRQDNGCLFLRGPCRNRAWLTKEGALFRPFRPALWSQRGWWANLVTRMETWTPQWGRFLGLLTSSGTEFIGILISIWLQNLWRMGRGLNKTWCSTNGVYCRFLSSSKEWENVCADRELRNNLFHQLPVNSKKSTFLNCSCRCSSWTNFGVFPLETFSESLLCVP